MTSFVRPNGPERLGSSLAAPLRGLVLIGGKSRRMGRDKWGLRYGEQTQAERTFELLAPHCVDVRLSLREEQGVPELVRHPHLFDRIEGLGPLSGMLTAMREDPSSAFLVVACDLPFLDAATVDALCRRRDPSAPATSYRSARDGLPEPLCAIYEPTMRVLLERAADEGARARARSSSARPIASSSSPGPRRSRT